MAINDDWRIIGFHEKVKRPPEIPGRPGWRLASMGNYIFETGVLAASCAATPPVPLQ